MKKPLKLDYTKRKKVLAIAFLIPALLVFAVFIVYPLYMTINLSFRNVRMISPNMSDQPLTLGNYARIFSDDAFWKSVWKTMVFTFLGTAISFVIGMFTAMLLNQRFRGRTIARSIIMFSWPIPAIAVSTVFIWMLNADFGIVNQLLRSSGIIGKNIAWLITPKTAFVSVMGTAIWKAYPFFTLMILAGLQNIPLELYEASAIDGASAVKQFFSVTLPGIVSISAVSILLNGVWFFKNFDIVYNMTGGGPARSTELLSLKLYIEGFQYSHMGIASAIGVVSFALCVVFILIAMPFMEKDFY